jgi:hypothetical protein
MTLAGRGKKNWKSADLVLAVCLAATSGGPTMFARIGIMRAMNRAATFANLIRTGKTIIGDGGCWRGTDECASAQCFTVLSVVPAGERIRPSRD